MGCTVRAGDQISVEITQPIQEAAVKLLAAIVAEIRGHLPGATMDDLTRSSINVALAYFHEQQAEEPVVSYPFPQYER